MRRRPLDIEALAGQTGSAPKHKSVSLGLVCPRLKPWKSNKSSFWVDWVDPFTIIHEKETEKISLKQHIYWKDHAAKQTTRYTQTQQSLQRALWTDASRPMESRRYNLKLGRTFQQSTSQWNAGDPERRQKCKTKSVLHTTANYRTQANYASTTMQMKVQKQQSTAHDRKNDTWSTAGYEKSKKSSKYCGHTS